jgi:hypothetical protein
MIMADLKGGCLCGAVRYEVSGEPLRIVNCHCDACRKTTGSAFATNVFFKEDDIKIVQGSLKTFQHAADSGSTMTKEFCENCGSQIFGFGSRGVGVKGLKAGSLDDPSGIVPALDIYISRKLPGVVLSDDTEHHEMGRPQ